MDNKALTKELNKTQQSIDEIEKTLIEALNTIGIEMIDFNTILNHLDIYTTKKHKLQYLLATNIG